MKKGYTKRDRGTIDSDIFLFKPDKRFKIWFYIVSSVQYQDYKKWRRGENWFTYEKISSSTGATKQQIYKCVKFLKKSGMIDTQQETRGFNVKVLNYGKYQDKKKPSGDAEEIEGRYGGDTEDDTIDKEEKNIRIKDFVKRRNGKEKIGSLNGLKKCNKITDSIKQEFLKLSKTYSNEDFTTAVVNYMKDVIARDQTNDYANHRFSLYEFLKQKNGFIKFLNQ